MGEYYNWVNINKHEFICPNDFDCGNKLFETMWQMNPLLSALHVLLAGRWSGDRIFFMGDERLFLEAFLPMIMSCYVGGSEVTCHITKEASPERWKSWRSKHCTERRSAWQRDGSRESNQRQQSQEQLYDRIDCFAENGEAAENLDEIKTRLDAIKEEKAGLLAKKSERDVNYAHIDTLLGVIDSIEGKEIHEKDWPDACSEYVDFMERTREKRQPGPVTQFKDEDFERYVEEVIVHGCSLEVLFKAGVSVEVES